ncbi:MAG: hypothetical protein ABII22_01020 [Candidatus Micrarchaeota archaeon]
MLSKKRSMTMFFAVIALVLAISVLVTIFVNLLIPRNQDVLANETEINKTMNQTVDLWSQIGKSSVERNCLLKAKELAREKGYPDFAVFGCSCSAEETKDKKQYNCKVDALDGKHPFSLTCIREKENCTIGSEEETGVFSFTELDGISH